MSDDTPNKAPAARGFDADALREKYRAERAKRLRTDGTAQYHRVEGGFARYAEDPYAAPAFTRAPISEDLDVVIVGGGFGGMLLAVRLHQAGFKDVRVIEKGGDFGGTWYWNRYPGVACDIESYIYMPLLEETGYIPVEKYSKGAELFEHSKVICRKFGLYEKGLLQTQVTELRWDENISRWHVRTDRGDALRARFVCMAAGFLHLPKLPGIPGLESFRGRIFHSSRWDYAYTGGNAKGDLVNLKDKRVGVVGTGATAVQCVPHLGQWAEHLYVFQRTPSSIGVRNNRPTDFAWAKGLTPGWQKRRMENFNVLVCGGKQDEDLVSDGWTDIFSNSGRAPAGSAEHAQFLQLADFEKMERMRARIDEIVADRATAEALKPYYNIMCKRPCFHDEYLATFNRPNVTLVDTQGKGVERITAHGAVAAGKEYALDCLIFATGFEFQTAFSERTGVHIHGRGGASYNEKWKDGISTLHGLHSHGFPNCFIIGDAQQGTTANKTHILEELSAHLVYIIKYCADHHIQTVEAEPDAEQAWVDDVMSYAETRRAFDEECTPGYYNSEGMPSALSVRNGFYGGGPVAYMRVLAEWRADGRLKGLKLSAAK